MCHSDPWKPIRDALQEYVASKGQQKLESTTRTNEPERGAGISMQCAKPQYLIAELCLQNVGQMETCSERGFK